MKPLIVLLATFIIFLLTHRFMRGVYDFALAGRVAMAVMLLFTAIGHFVFTKGMAMMLPDFIPYKVSVVYLTGFIEIAAAAGLFISSIRHITAWLLIVFFILILPANIHAAMQQVDYQKGTLNGDGVNYLWFRIPLQILFILWVYFSALYK